MERNENQIVVSASQDQSDIVRNYAVKWCTDLGVDYLEDDGNIIFPGGKTAYFLPCNPRTVQHVISFLTASWESPDLQVPALATLLFVDQDCSCLQANGPP